MKIKCLCQPKEAAGVRQKRPNVSLGFVLYQNDRFFRSRRYRRQRATTRVLSATLGGQDHSLVPDHVEIMFRPTVRKPVNKLHSVVFICFFWPGYTVSPVVTFRRRTCVQLWLFVGCWFDSCWIKPWLEDESQPREDPINCWCGWSEDYFLTFFNIDVFSTFLFICEGVMDENIRCVGGSVDTGPRSGCVTEDWWGLVEVCARLSAILVLAGIDRVSGPDLLKLEKCCEWICVVN